MPFVGVIELHQIAEQKSNGEPSIQQLEDFTEPPKKKPRKGGRKKKSETEGTVIIDGQTIIATGEQVCYFQSHILKCGHHLLYNN